MNFGIFRAIELSIKYIYLHLRIDRIFFPGSWRNNLNEVVHTVLRKGVYNLIEVISNKPNK